MRSAYPYYSCSIKKGHAVTIMNRSTLSKTAPKFLTFFIPFRGERGGLHEVKFRMKLIAGTGNDGIVTENHAKKIQERAATRSQRYVTRKVAWHRKLPGTNYGRGTFVGYLIYGLPLNEILKSPKVKPGWEGGNHPRNDFWYGEK